MEAANVAATHDARKGIHDQFTMPVQLPPVLDRPTPLTETTTMTPNEKEIVRIDLTSEQKEQVKAATEKSADAIELTVQELEARIAPAAGVVEL